MPEPDAPVLLEAETAWGVRLTLNRPAKLNALSAELVEALVGAIDRATVDARVRVVVIEGAGRAFSAGYDLTEESDAGALGPVEWRELLATDVEATLRILDCPKPVIAQVHGYALAGGLELAMACDLVVAADGTRLGEPEIRYGSAPVTLLMPYLIGQKKTRELLLTGDLIDAVEAERIGLINRVVPPERLAAEVEALADRLARTPPEVMGPTKRMLNRAMDAAGFRLAVEAGIDLGVDHQRRRHAGAARVGRDRPERGPQGGPRLARPPLRRAACRGARARSCAVADCPAVELPTPLFGLPRTAPVDVSGASRHRPASTLSRRSAWRRPSRRGRSRWRRRRW